MTSEERALIQQALEGLEDRRSEIADWGAYASDYFQEKWGLASSITAYDGVIEQLRDYLNRAEEFSVYARYDAAGASTTDDSAVQSILLVRKIS